MAIEVPLLINTAKRKPRSLGKSSLLGWRSCKAILQHILCFILLINSQEVKREQEAGAEGQAASRKEKALREAQRLARRNNPSVPSYCTAFFCLFVPRRIIRAIPYLIRVYR